MQGFLNRRERKERRVVSASVHSVCSCSEFVCNQARSTRNRIANPKSESRYPKQIQNPNCECPKGAREGRQSARIRSVAGGSRPYARLPTSDPPLPYSTTPPLHHVLSVVRGPFLSVVIREIRGLALEITQSTLDRMHRIHRMEGIDFGLLGAHSVPLGDTLTLLLFPCWHFRGPPRTAVEAADFPPAWRAHHRRRGALFRKLDHSSTVANCNGKSCRAGSGEWAKFDAEWCGREGCSSFIEPRMTLGYGV